jgi:hypothetical protein
VLPLLGQRVRTLEVTHDDVDFASLLCFFVCVKAENRQQAEKEKDRKTIVLFISQNVCAKVLTTSVRFLVLFAEKRRKRKDGKKESFGCKKKKTAKATGLHLLHLSAGRLRLL